MALAGKLVPPAGFEPAISTLKADPETNELSGGISEGPIHAGPDEVEKISGSVEGRPEGSSEGEFRRIFDTPEEGE